MSVEPVALPLSRLMCRLGLDHRVFRDGLGRFCHRLVVRGDEPGLDRRARPRPALEQAALDQQQIDPFARRGHARLMISVG